MQQLAVKVSKLFIDKSAHAKLSPIKITPVDGYIYKHHFVITEIKYEDNILVGLIGSAEPGELEGQTRISLDGEHEETAEIVKLIEVGVH